MKNFLILSLSILTLCTCEAQIGAKTQQGKIHGTWVNNSFGYEMVLKLNTNGTGEFDGEPITFKSENNQLSITEHGETNTYSYIIQGNSLTVSGGDLDNPITLTKKDGEGNASTSSAIKTSDEVPAQIVGKWSNYGETWEFKNNGQCTYLGNAYTYSVAANNIIVQTPQGNLVMPYSIQGNELKVSVNGNQFVYMKGNASQTPSAKTATPSGKKNIDQSLVGKWCYVNVTSTNTGGSSTDACITINADGTYSYYSERSMSVNTSTVAGGTASQNSDSGTWWVEGSRIYYISQTQGQGSYQLQKINHPKNNDPMIVLDGTTYVTAYQKAPW